MYSVGVIPPVPSYIGVPCPRCKGSGEELVFMHYHTCQVCEGAKTVPKQTADDENERRESEASWLKNK